MLVCCLSLCFSAVYFSAGTAHPTPPPAPTGSQPALAATANSPACAALPLVSSVSGIQRAGVATPHDNTWNPPPPPHPLKQKRVAALCSINIAALGRLAARAAKCLAGSTRRGPRAGGAGGAGSLHDRRESRGEWVGQVWARAPRAVVGLRGVGASSRARGVESGERMRRQARLKTLFF